MSLYGYDVPFYDYGFSDPAIVGSLYGNSPMIMSSSFTAIDDDNYYDRKPKPRPSKITPTTSPPKHRHDGTSPLPLGMDWSPPPRIWDGPNSVWPHDPRTGWSYCVTIPSWTILPYARGPDSVVFYRVQVGIQSPEGITTTRGVLRRFNDFLKLFSDLRKAFPKKTLPSAPPRRFLKMRSRTLLEERSCALEDWVEKLLSDIDLSRTALVAIFLELEAAVRSSFSDSNQNVSDANSVNSTFPWYQFPPNLGASLRAGSSSMTLDCGNTSAYGTPELGTPTYGRDNCAESNMENASYKDLTGPAEETDGDNLSGNGVDLPRKDFVQGNQVRYYQHKMQSRRENSAIDTYREGEMDISSRMENCNLGSHVRRLSNESVGSDVSSMGACGTSNSGIRHSLGDNYLQLPERAEVSRTTEILLGSDLQFADDLLVTLPSDERNKINRVLITMQQRLGTAKMDMENLIARLNQEIVVRQYLTTKVKDLEVELETTCQTGKENLQQAILIERERFTQMQWDMEEHGRKCMEMEFKLKSEQDTRLHMESIKLSVVQENEMLLQELDDAKEQIENLKKQHDELELKSKSDVKLLIKEVKSLRSSHCELKQELSRCLKEKCDLEEEKQRWEHANAAKAKLLHECEILRNRLRECSVNFLIEEEDKLIMDTSSPSDAIDLLATSDNRIGLLLAEAQLLAQDVEKAITAAKQNVNCDGARKTDDDMRMLLTDIFIDNGKLRKQVNSVIRCALNTPEKTEKDDAEDDAPPPKTVLSKFLDR